MRLFAVLLISTFAFQGQARDCWTSKQISELTEKQVCRSIGSLTASTRDLRTDCHTQGIAVDLETKSLIVSCMERKRPVSHVMFFEQNNELPKKVLSIDLGDKFKHPSAFQISNGVFPVAFASDQNSGSSKIFFFDVEFGVSPGFEIPKHLGALAYSSFRDSRTLIGCGWDCNYWIMYRSSSSGSFETVKQGETSKSIDSRGIDANVGAYNSLSLHRRCEDGKDILVATADKWLDVFEITDGRWKKIGKRNFGWDIFHEGMTIVEKGEKLQILAAPHDFKDENCGFGRRCMSDLYLCEVEK